MGRTSRRIAVGCLQEFAPSFEFSEARRQVASLSIRGGQTLTRPPHIMEINPSSASSHFASHEVLCVRCCLSLSRPIISLFNTPNMHVAWKQVFGREMESRTCRYFDFDFDGGLGSSTGADQRCTKHGEPAVCVSSCLHVPERSCPSHGQSSVRYLKLDVRDCENTCDV
jgi:hypothetical protein